MPAGLTVEQGYIFDLAGFLVVRGVLTAEEVEEFNNAIDSQASDIRERTGSVRNSNAAVFQGDGTTGRRDCGRMLEWPRPSCLPFRRLLTHPKLIPILNDLLGEGYRMDHLPVLITQTKGAEGFDFHGGAIDTKGEWAHSLAYHCRGGLIRNTLLAVSVQLCDTSPQDGGFVVLPGSHKANFPLPASIGRSEQFTELMHRPPMKAGDVLLFSEACSHGALPWAADHERRVVLYRFAPATVGYGRGVYDIPEEVLADMSPAERAVLAPPYHNRLDRPWPLPNGSGEVKVGQPRATDKKAFDKAVFGHPYF